MYRQTDDRKVWYEWMVEVYALERTAASAKATPVSYARAGSPNVESLKPKENAAKKTHRTGYRRVRVGMSDLHSSIKDGCLM
jgi:protein arginine N-methyltransferase 5